MPKLSQIQQFKDCPNRQIHILVEIVLSDFIAVSESIRLNFINAVAQIQSALQFSLISIFSLLAVFSIFECLAGCGEHFIIIQELAIYIDKTIRVDRSNNSFENIVFQGRFNLHNKRIEQRLQLGIELIHSGQFIKTCIGDDVGCFVDIAVPFIPMIITDIHQLTLLKGAINRNSFLVT